jgi:hypothetical protein
MAEYSATYINKKQYPKIFLGREKLVAGKWPILSKIGRKEAEKYFIAIYRVKFPLLWCFPSVLINKASNYVNEVQYLSNFLNFILFQYMTVHTLIGQPGIFGTYLEGT